MAHGWVVLKVKGFTPELTALEVLFSLTTAVSVFSFFFSVTNMYVYTYTNMIFNCSNRR